MDMSDGLVKDLERMLRASGVARPPRAADVPLSAAARTVVAAGARAGWGASSPAGDDYEVLAARPARPRRLRSRRGGRRRRSRDRDRHGLTRDPPALAVMGPDGGAAGRSPSAPAGTTSDAPRMRHFVCSLVLQRTSDFWHGPAANPAPGCGLRRGWLANVQPALNCACGGTAATKGERPWIR